MTLTTVFGKIIQGKIPCKKVFENEHFLLWVNCNPLPAKGFSCGMVVESYVVRLKRGLKY